MVRSYTRGIALLGCLAGMLGVAVPALMAQPAVKKKLEGLFENVTLAPRFQPDPYVLRGISGGADEMQKHSGRSQTETGPCLGFVDTLPDHQITLTKGFQYLKLSVRSSGDTTLLIKGPGGSWCNDDGSDRNPAIAGNWLAGTYSVWVGSYETEASFPYLIELSETK